MPQNDSPSNDAGNTKNKILSFLTENEVNPISYKCQTNNQVKNSGIEAPSLSSPFQKPNPCLLFCRNLK